MRTFYWFKADHEAVHYVHRKIASYLDEQEATFPALTDDELGRMAVDESINSIAKVRLPRSLMAATLTKLSIQFLRLILKVVITPPNEILFHKIRDLPDPAPQIILDLWKEMIDPAEDEEVDRSSDVDSGRRSSNDGSAFSAAHVVDRELLLEQHLAQLRSQLDRCEAEVQDLREAKEQTDDAYNRLQESYDAVRKESTETGMELKKLTARNNERDHRSVRELETKISQQEEIIGRQEAQINEHQSKEAEMQRKLKKLDAAEDRLQNLQDDFDVQKMELEHQTKKANAGEKYKQKVQASQKIEKERDSLRNELNEARSRLEEAGNLRRVNSKLQQENREISQTLSRSERDNTELRETKQAYLSEINRLHHDSKSLRDALTRSQDRITEMEETQRSPERSSSVDGGLESELAEALNHQEEMQVARLSLLWTRVLMNTRKARISELEKQVRQLTSDVNDKDKTVAVLQGQLNGAQEDSADRYEQGLRLHREISVLQSSLTEVREGLPIEGSVSAVSLVDLVAYDVQSTEAFKEMRAKIKAEQKKCAHLEERLSVAQKALEAAESDRMSSFENHCMMTDLTVDLFEGALAEKPKLQIVEEVRMQNSLAMRQLQSEYDALRKRHNRMNDMFIDLTEERNAAWRESHEAVMAKGEIGMQADAYNQTLQEASELLRHAATTKSSDPSKDIEVYANKIEEGRERLAKAQKVCKQFVPSAITSETVARPRQPAPTAPSSSASHLSSLTSSHSAAAPQHSSSPKSPSSSSSRFSPRTSSNLASTASERFIRALSLMKKKRG